MTDGNEQQKRRNDSLQSGEGDLALGQDPRSLGAGGQVIERPLEPGPEDAPNRDVGRDESIPEGQHPSRGRESAAEARSKE